MRPPHFARNNSVEEHGDGQKNLRLIIHFVWSVFVEQKRYALLMVGALLVLAFFQNLFLVITGVFLPALLTLEPGEAFVSGAIVFPQSVRDYIPELGALVVPTGIFIRIVPSLILLSGVGIGVGSYLYQVNQSAISLLVAKNFRLRLFTGILGQNFADVIRRSPSEWMSVVMNDVQFIQTRISDVLNSIIRDGVKILSALTLLFIIHWPTALFVAGVSPFIGMGMGRIGKVIARYSEQFQKELGRMAASILDIRQRFSFIRAQSGEVIENRRFDSIVTNYYGQVRDSILIRSAFAPGLEFIGFAFFALVLFFVNQGWFSTSLNPSTFFPFLVAIAMMVKPLGSIGEQLGKFHETAGVLRSSLALFYAIERDSVSAGTPVSLISPESLTIDKVEVAYGGDFRFSGEGLKLGPAATIAVVGPSGAGKSTLLKCLAGLIEPKVWEGSCSWQQVVGTSNLVSQTPFLFSATIQENLLYGQQTGRLLPSDQEIWDALEFVGLGEFVDNLPQKLDSAISAIATNISGGQVQRLVIARALLRPRSLILLDEATSAVDPKNEREIVLRTLALAKERNRTLIAVTHRLQWIAEYDEVWFVEAGRVVAKGPHHVLVRNSRYAEFVGQDGMES